jgi:hypothetical protein
MGGRQDGIGSQDRHGLHLFFPFLHAARLDAPRQDGVLFATASWAEIDAFLFAGSRAAVASDGAPLEVDADLASPASPKVRQAVVDCPGNCSSWCSLEMTAEGQCLVGVAPVCTLPRDGRLFRV